MENLVERCLGTRGKDENTTGMVTFPCNEEELLEQFGVEDTKDLYFVDRPESKMSVSQFNYIMREAEARAAKIESQIDASVKFLQLRMEENPEWKGTSDVVPLSFEDQIVWNWCMKKDYQHPEEKVKVWCYSGELNVFYGEKKDTTGKEKKSGKR